MALILGRSMNNFNSRETAIGEGLLDDGEGARDHGLAGDNGGEHSHHKHRPVERTYKTKLQFDYYKILKCRGRMLRI